MRCSFRHFWACLPWRSATFHTLSPDAVADLGSHVLNGDRAVLELQHALDWRPVLQQLGSVHAPDPLVAREACRWATQLACLALRAFILLTPSELPLWWASGCLENRRLRLVTARELSRDRRNGRARRRLQRMLAVDLSLPGQDPGELVWVPSLQEVLRDLDIQGIMQLRGILCSRMGGVPFLLQPLVVSPTLVQVSNRLLSELHDQTRADGMPLLSLRKGDQS